LLADNKDIVDAFDAKVQEKIKQEEQQTIAQEAQREVVEKSFGGRSFS
jgi:chitinase, class I